MPGQRDGSIVHDHANVFFSYFGTPLERIKDILLI
jgi:hypothetical protein